MLGKGHWKIIREWGSLNRESSQVQPHASWLVMTPDLFTSIRRPLTPTAFLSSTFPSKTLKNRNLKLERVALNRLTDHRCRTTSLSWNSRPRPYQMKKSGQIRTTTLISAETPNRWPPQGSMTTTLSLTLANSELRSSFGTWTTKRSKLWCRRSRNRPPTKISSNISLSVSESP